MYEHYQTLAMVRDGTLYLIRSTTDLGSFQSSMNRKKMLIVHLVAKMLMFREGTLFLKKLGSRLFESKARNLRSVLRWMKAWLSFREQVAFPSSLSYFKQTIWQYFKQDWILVTLQCWRPEEKVGYLQAWRHTSFQSHRHRPCCRALTVESSLHRGHYSSREQF